MCLDVYTRIQFDLISKGFHLETFAINLLPFLVTDFYYYLNEIWYELSLKTSLNKISSSRVLKRNANRHANPLIKLKYRWLTLGVLHHTDTEVVYAY